MTDKQLTVADFINLAKNRKGKFLRNGHLIHPVVVYDYRKMNGNFCEIVTDPSLHRPKYFTAKWVEKEREENQDSFFNNDSQGHSHLRVYDIENKGWRTLRTWEIITEIEVENPLLLNWPEEWDRVHEELVETAKKKSEERDNEFYARMKHRHVKFYIHCELLRKVDTTNTNWADNYFESVKDNQRLRKKNKKLLQRIKELKEKYKDLKEDFERIATYRIR